MHEHVLPAAPWNPLSSNKPPLIIDKASMTIAIDETDHREAIRETMFFYAKEAEYPFGKHGWKSAKGGRYESALQVHAPNPSGHIGGKWSKESVLVQCNPKNGKGGFLRLEWNPAKWRELGAVAHLWGKLEEIMCSPPNFDEFLLAAKVTRLDLAIDIEGVRPDDCAWELPKASYRNNIMRAGKLQTQDPWKQQNGQDKGTGSHLRQGR